MKALLERITDNGTQTIGRMFVIDEEEFTLTDFPTMELPWKNNKRRVSCIPTGTYKVIKHTSPRFGRCFWVQDVPGRSEILIHPANYHSDLLGCIGVGSDLRDLNKDGEVDITASRKAVKELLKWLPSEFELEIVNGPYL